MIRVIILVTASWWLKFGLCRDEERILKACFWPNEVYEPCFGGCAEVSCDNPRNHLRPCYPYCEPGCICEDPYVRDDRTHQCVLPQDCSPTQMGIPVPSRRGNGKFATGKYEGRSPRHQQKRNEILLSPADVQSDNEIQSPIQTHSSIPHVEEFKRGSEVSRMGNYFNIVIAPPPIKALQPRKLLTPTDVFRTNSRKMDN